MKKLVVLLCTGLMVFSIAACGKKDDGTVESTQAVTEESVQESTDSAETVPAETETAGTDSTADAGNTDAAVEWSEEMTAVRQALVDNMGENYWPNMAVTPEMLEGTFGVASDLYDDYFAEIPMMSTHVDTLLIIKAKSDKVEDVEKALNTYRENLVNDTMQYPMNLGKIQASRIERIGDYVCFVQLGGDTMEASESGDEAVITQCQEQNELAIEIIGQNVEH